MTTGPVSERIRIASQEAAYWYIRYMDEPNMKVSDKKLLLAWVKRSPENVAEMLRMADLDGCVARQRVLEIVKESEQSNIVDINSRGSHSSQYEYNPSDSVPDMVRTKLSAGWAYAAMISVLAVALMYAFTMRGNPRDGTVATAASQWQHMSLEDGSVVYLDARTRVQIEYTSKQRLVHLYAGEAVFEVAKNRDRPFTVRTSIVDVTAVGTRFGVAINPGVTTTVSEGVVKVTPRGKLDDPAAVRVSAGQQVRLFGPEGLNQVPRFFGRNQVDLSKVHAVKADVESALAWVDGHLQFNDRTVGEMANEFNRRNAVQIVIEGRRIADIKLPGYFRFDVDKPESFVKVLESQEGVIVNRDDRNVLLLKE